MYNLRAIHDHSKIESISNVSEKCTGIEVFRSHETLLDKIEIIYERREPHPVLASLAHYLIGSLHQ